MERAEAEAVYDAGREVVVEVLLRMDRRVQQLGARVEKLERELKKSSRNSSRPPSSDLPSAPVRSKDRSGRKRGAQDGHEGRGRPLLPTWAVDEIVEHWPERCRCGRVFSEGEGIAVGEPARHQVEELPPINVRVSEHRAQRVRCPECGRRTRAALPGEVVHSAFGPRLEAAVATLSVRNRVSRDDAVELIEELFGARISSGTVDAILTRTAAAATQALLKFPHETNFGDAGGTNPRNNSSAILSLMVDSQHLLYLGDAGVPVINPALDYLREQDRTSACPAVLVLPHHGSRRNLDRDTIQRILGDEDTSRRWGFAVASVSAESDNGWNGKVEPLPPLAETDLED